MSATSNSIIVVASLGDVAYAMTLVESLSHHKVFYRKELLGENVFNGGIGYDYSRQSVMSIIDEASHCDKIYIFSKGFDPLIVLLADRYAKKTFFVDVYKNLYSSESWYKNLLWIPFRFAKMVVWFLRIGVIVSNFDTVRKPVFHSKSELQLFDIQPTLHCYKVNLRNNTVIIIQDETLDINKLVVQFESYGFNVMVKYDPRLVGEYRGDNALPNLPMELLSIVDAIAVVGSKSRALAVTDCQTIFSLFTEGEGIDYDYKTYLRNINDKIKFVTERELEELYQHGA